MPLHSHTLPHSTREMVELLRDQGELKIIEREVDPYLELAEIQRQTVAQKGPALLFTNVKGCKFSVATNLYGSANRIDLAFGKKPQLFIKDLVHLVETALPPQLNKLWSFRRLLPQLGAVGTKRVGAAPVLAQTLKNGARDLPQITCWPEDGGPFITLPLVYTQSPSTQKSNLGMYRIQLFEAQQVGMHIQVHRGGGYHYHEAEKQNQALPVHIYVGGPPALTLAAIAPLPEDVPELMLASLILGQKLKMSHKPHLSPYPFIAEADFCLLGEIPPHKRRHEGPFGDHYGYYALQHDYPFVNLKNVYCREDAIYPATVVGRPPQEDHYLANYLQELLSPFFPLVMPGVQQIWAYEESGVHSLAATLVKERYPHESFRLGMRVLSEGQLSLTKFLLVSDQQNLNLKNVREVFTHFARTVNLQKDLFIFSNVSQDTLDYTTRTINEGSKAILRAVGPQIRAGATPAAANRCQKENWLNQNLGQGFWYCPGVLVLEASAFAESPNLGEQLSTQAEPAYQDFTFVFIVDHGEGLQAVQKDENFIWTLFTRFEPGSDIHGQRTLIKNHVGFNGPLIVDCRLKPWFPKVLTVSSEITERARSVLSK